MEIKEIIKDNFVIPQNNYSIRYMDLPAKLPYPIAFEFSRIKTIENASYGMVFLVRDLYETVLKLICLSVCYHMMQNDDDSFCEILLSPKQMSFGDWLNNLAPKLRKSAYVTAKLELKHYLNKLTTFYNKTGIVKWRNDLD